MNPSTMLPLSAAYAVVHTTTTSEPRHGELLIRADLRTTEKNPVADELRIRRIMLPFTHWGLRAGMYTHSGNQPAASEALDKAVLDYIKSLAADRLNYDLGTERTATTVALCNYTVGALLAFAVENAASKGSLPFTFGQVNNYWSSADCAAAAALVANRDAAAAAAVKKAALSILERACSPRLPKGALTEPELLGAIQAISLDIGSPEHGVLAEQLVGRLHYILSRDREARVAAVNPFEGLTLG